jgi:hypothetical protein
MGRTSPFRGERRKVCNRRNLAVAVPFGEGLFTTRFADLTIYALAPDLVTIWSVS